MTIRPSHTTVWHQLNSRHAIIGWADGISLVSKVEASAIANGSSLEVPL